MSGTLSVYKNLEQINKVVLQACKNAHRKIDDVSIIAVTKHQPIEKMNEAFHAGLIHFGENYLQEAKVKINSFLTHKPTWHFIGSLQRKKVKSVIDLFDYIHSVDGIKLANEIQKIAEIKQMSQKVFIQVNIAHEDSKTGVTLDSTELLFSQMKLLPNVKIMGLMAMPPWVDDSEINRPHFKKIRELRDYLSNKYSYPLPYLSMGTSIDYKSAIEEGATHIRLGTQLLGERKNHDVK